jgi:hypothetical protein
MVGVYVSQECGLRVLLRLYQDQVTVHRARVLLDLLPY